MRKLFGLISAVFFGTVLAQASLPPFEDVDANKDGQISKEEAANVEGLDFASADANQDGMLSREEYEAAATK
jgi:EF hand